MSKKIQGYTLLEKIGKGGFGEVYRAVHCTKPGEFAVKVVQNQLLQNPKAEQCLINQVQILSKIGYCQSIVGFHQLIKSKNNHYFVYDYCNGGNLYEKLKKAKNKRISETQVVTYVKDLLTAFKLLNKFKVLHRDLKPENMLFHNGKIKLADFGFCKSLRAEYQMTKTMIGSPFYMAPEVLKGQEYNSKADIWSLGVIIYQMLYGAIPFVANSIPSLSQKIDTTSLEFPSQPIVSEGLKQALRKMLTKDDLKRIGWVELFKQFGLQNNQFVSSRSIYEPDQSRSKSIGKSKRTSLCFIESNINQATQKQPKNDLQNTKSDKENKSLFTSSKYINYLNKCENSPIITKSSSNNEKKTSNFSASAQGYYSTHQSTFIQPTYSKNYQSTKPSTYLSSLESSLAYNSNNPIFNNNSSTYGSTSYNNPSYINSSSNYTSNLASTSQSPPHSFSQNKPYQHSNSGYLSALSNFNISANNNKLDLSYASTTKSEKQKQARNFILKLQKLHAQFVDISPYCESLIRTKVKQNVSDVLELLLVLKSKLSYFNREFSKVRSEQVWKNHEDLQTMIKYQIMGIDQTLQQIYAITGDRYKRNFSSNSREGFYPAQNEYRFKSYQLQKSCGKINQIQI